MIQSRAQFVGRLIEAVSLFVLLIVVALRPLIGESYDLAGLAMTSALKGIADPLPLHTLLMDAAILAAAFGWAVAKGLGPRRRYRWCGLEVGLGLVVLAAVVSCAVANDKRVAINASVDWVSTATVAVVLAQLLRGRRAVRLALCVIVASAAAQAYRCFDQVLVGFAETERMYDEQREAFWQAQGMPPDSPQVVLFESRMNAREASGYYAHSNVAGAHLMLTFFAALGAVAGRRPAGGGSAADRIALAAMAAVAAFLLAAIVLTHSMGAVLACAAGLALWAIRYAARKWISSHRTQALGLAWGMAAGGVLAVVGHGMYHSSLPGTSLNFRWGYWTASARLIADHPWTGVGRENFGDAYLTYKQIAAPEEVKNPHSFLVGAAADWGVIGLVGVVTMAVGGSIAVTRRPPEADANAAQSDTATPATGALRLWMLLLVLGAFGLRLGLLGSDDRNYLFVETVPAAMVWLLAFAVCAVGPDPCEHVGRDGWSRVAVAINCGLFAFLLQDTINFAIIVPGAATTFFALVGVSIAARRVRVPQPAAADLRPSRHREEWGTRVWERWGFTAVAGLALVFVICAILPPLWRTAELVLAARSKRDSALAGPIAHHPANLLYRAAVEADPLDPTAPAERAEWLRANAGSTAEPVPVLREALASTDEAVARRPSNVAYHRQRATISLALAQLTHDPSDRARALESAERAIELYPTRPESYVDLANLQVWVGRTQERADLVEAAVEHYRHALDLDSQRPSWETIRGFRPAMVEQIESRIAEARAWLAGHTK